MDAHKAPVQACNGLVGADLNWDIALVTLASESCFVSHSCSTISASILLKKSASKACSSIHLRIGFCPLETTRI